MRERANIAWPLTRIEQGLIEDDMTFQKFPALLLLVSTVIGVTARANDDVALYRVPVEDAPELKVAAEYEIRLKKSYPEHQDVLEYELPVELVGRRERVQLNQVASGFPGLLKYTGAQGVAICFEEAGTFVCSIKYKDLEIDPMAVEQTVRRMNSDPLKAANRLQVARRFAGEPQGILRYRLAPHLPY